KPKVKPHSRPEFNSVRHTFVAAKINSPFSERKQQKFTPEFKKGAIALVTEQVRLDHNALALKSAVYYLRFLAATQ
ncbi:MAG: hypothetical protein AAFO08_02190, partial [Pseudomonadota bacterium]